MDHNGPKTTFNLSQERARVSDYESNINPVASSFHPLTLNSELAENQSMEPKHRNILINDSIITAAVVNTIIITITWVRTAPNHRVQIDT